MSEFRAAVTPTQPAPSQPAAPADIAATTTAPTLFATYQDDLGKPYTADYYGVPELWDKSEGLKFDLEVVEGYLRSKVRSNVINNDTKAVDSYLKNMEKEAKVNPYDPPLKRLDKLLAYIEFRKVVDGVS